MNKKMTRVTTNLSIVTLSINDLTLIKRYTLADRVN
jgi:hypothetical protein